MKTERAEIREILPQELADRLRRGDRPVILDVREPGEIEIARFPGATTLIPMSEVPSRIAELDPDAEMVVLCHHGIRSAQVAIYLARLGFGHVSNLRGGIDLWSATVDSNVPRY